MVAGEPIDVTTEIWAFLSLLMLVRWRSSNLIAVLAGRPLSPHNYILRSSSSRMVWLKSNAISGIRSLLSSTPVFLRLPMFALVMTCFFLVMLMLMPAGPHLRLRSFFAAFLGKRVNLKRSKLFFCNDTSEGTQVYLEWILGIPRGNNLGLYREFFMSSSTLLRVLISLLIR